MPPAETIVSNTIFTTALLGPVFTVSGGDVEDGPEAYHNKNYVKAIAPFKKAPERGQSDTEQKPAELCFLQRRCWPVYLSYKFHFESLKRRLGNRRYIDHLNQGE